MALAGTTSAPALAQRQGANASGDPTALECEPSSGRMLGHGLLGAVAGTALAGGVGAIAGSEAGAVTLLVAEPVGVAWGIHRGNCARGSFGWTTLGSYAGLGLGLGLLYLTVGTDLEGAIMLYVMVQLSQLTAATVLQRRSEAE